MKRIKILISFFLVFILCSTSLYSNADTVEQKAITLSENIHSESALIMESSTGKVVYEKNGYQVRYPASTTKVLTAILAIENCDLDELATASEFAVNSIPYDYSIANIKVGEQVSVRDLLYALMLHSANETAYILAEHISGSNEEFAKLMNEKAKEIGCENSHFVNPNGIQDENHYSTAYDMALITRYAMQNEIFREIVKTTSYTVSPSELYPENDRTFTNTNHLIIPSTEQNPNKYYYPYAIGVKTGYTSAALNCLISAANKDGMEYISVVLGATTGYENGVSTSYRYTDSISMFDFAFNNYLFKDLTEENAFVKTIDIPNLGSLDVATDSSVSILVDVDEFNNTIIEPEIDIYENISAPIKKGDVVGTISYIINGKEYSSQLVSMDDIDPPLLEQISMQLKDYSFYYVLASLLLILGFLILLTTVLIVFNKKRKNKKALSKSIVKAEILKEEPRSETSNFETEDSESSKLKDEIKENQILSSETTLEINSQDNNVTNVENLSYLDDENNDNDWNDELSGELSSEILKEKNKNKRS